MIVWKSDSTLEREAENLRLGDEYIFEDGTRLVKTWDIIEWRTHWLLIKPTNSKGETDG